LGRLVHIRVQYLCISRNDLLCKLHVESGPLNPTPCFLPTISTPETILKSKFLWSIKLPKEINDYKKK